MKKIVPIRLELDLYKKAKMYRGLEHLTMPELINGYLENNRIVEIPEERTVSKKHKWKEFKSEFQFKLTSIQLDVQQIERLLFIYPSRSMNRIIEGLLIDFIKSKEPEWVPPYHNDLTFFNTYSYKEVEFIQAYERLIREFPDLTQRDYEKNRKNDEPTLYAVRKKYKTYTNYKENMAKISCKKLRD